jgi:hypothetical protein
MISFARKVGVCDEHLESCVSFLDDLGSIRLLALGHPPGYVLRRARELDTQLAMQRKRLQSEREAERARLREQRGGGGGGGGGGLNMHKYASAARISDRRYMDETQNRSLGHETQDKTKL